MPRRTQAGLRCPPAVIETGSPHAHSLGAGRCRHRSAASQPREEAQNHGTKHGTEWVHTLPKTARSAQPWSCTPQIAQATPTYLQRSSSGDAGASRVAPQHCFTCRGAVSLPPSPFTVT